MKKYGYWLIFGLLWLVLLGLYSWTTAPGPTGFADSDELLAVGYHFGVAHPPGYPLLVLLTGLAMHGLVWIDSLAQRGHVLSAGLMSIGILGLAGWFWLESQRLLKNGYERWVAVIGVTLVVGLSVPIWRYASVLEVVSLTMVFMSSLLLLSWWIRGSMTGWKLWLLAGVLGMGLGHHQLLVLLVPGITIWLFADWWQSDKRWIWLLGGVVSLLVGFALSYGWLGWWGIRSYSTPVSWWFDPTEIGSWWHLLTRGDYTGAFIEKGKESNAYLKEVFTGDGLSGIWYFYTRMLPGYIGWGGLSFLLMGWYWLLSKCKDTVWKWGLVAHGLFFGVFLPYYIPLSTFETGELHVLSVALAERFYGLGVIGVSLPIIYGAGWLLRWFDTGRWRNRRWRLALGFSLILIIAGWTAMESYPQVNLRGYGWMGAAMEISLSRLPENSVVICFSDISCFTSLYLQTVEGRRPDVLIVPVTPQLRERYLESRSSEVGFQSIGYQDNPYRIGDVMTTALANDRPVFVSQIPEFYVNWLGLNGEVAYIQPGYIWHELKCAVPAGQQNSYLDLPVDEAVAPWQKEFVDLLFESVMINAIVHARSGDKQDASAALFQANQYKPDTKEVHDAAVALPDYPGDERYLGRKSCLSETEVADRLQLCAPEDEACVLQGLNWLVMKDVTNTSYRMELGRALVDFGYGPLGKREYRLVLRQQPDNINAQQRLEELENVEDLGELY